MNSVWEDLEAGVLEGAGRLSSIAAKECWRQLHQRVRKLAEISACPGHAPWWIEIHTNARAFAVALSRSADATLGGHPSVSLCGLEGLADGARLSFRVHVDPSVRPSAQYTVALEGMTRGDEAPWFARIDLDALGRGRGRCSHALLHVHVGQVPDTGLQTRAPLPWLTPWEAFDWLLATADPRFEPCPHT